MLQTTLCYIEYEDCYLMLYRNKKENDQNLGKWIGVGGKVEDGETVEACLLREIREETGITSLTYEKRGIIDFHLEGWGSERMHLFTAKAEDNRFSECSEGVLRWIPKKEVFTLNLWEGDKVFLRKLLLGEKDFYLVLRYKEDELISVEESMITDMPK